MRWGRIAIAVALLLVAAAAGYGAYTLLGGSSQAALEENQREFPVQMGVLTREVSIDGSIVFPQKETLTFASRGLVDEILVGEGAEVKAGQTLASLDAESVAALRQAAAQAELDLLKARDDLAAAENPTLRLAESRQAVLDARVALGEAQRELDTLLDPTAHALAQARGAVLDAEAALREAWRELDSLLAPSAYDLSRARSAVVDAEAALRNARNRLDVEREDAQAQVDATRKDLAAARRSLQEASDTSGHTEHRMTVSSGERAYKDVVRKWTGVTLTADELALSPKALFEAWQFDLSAVYGQSFESLSGGMEGDNPATRWNELTVYAWTSLYPASDIIRAACDETEPPPVGVRGGKLVCVQQDVDRAWQSLDEARSQLSGLLVQYERGVAQAEAGVIRSEKALAEAETVLAGLDGGPRDELLRRRVVFAEADLAKAEADLARLSAPAPVEVEARRGRVAVAEAGLAKAEADLARLSVPDPVEVEAKRGRVAVTEANLAKAAAELAKLRERRELEVTLRETAVVAAQANLEGAVSRLDNSTLKAPWDGFVSKVMVEKNRQINAADPILELVDYAVAKVDGRVDEFEVLELEHGAVAMVTLDSLPDRTLEGTVSKVGSDANSERGSVTFKADVKITLPDGLRLQEGLRATARVLLGEERGLLVPNQAIRGEYDNPVVLVIDGEEFEERAVVLGGSDGFWTVVKEGLVEFDRIAIEVAPSDARGIPADVTVGGPPEPGEEAETPPVEEP